ncbi:hypothetical protein EW146_g5872 [Bondarzewia mesenterica]|uniref:RING-type domain-containing protein n=1 Tax=Bondarzewia mesenterica TaxID=1095465 RepID=A0A4S4LQ77_9AGAM|nr:hypothetical protein EW146_g5872 [Bondarzewia mesenterica]
MPATRSSVSRLRTRASDTPYSSSPVAPSTPTPPDNEIIVISSDDESEHPPRRSRVPARKGKSKARTSRVSTDNEVIEISDISSASDGRRVSGEVLELRKQIKRLEEKQRLLEMQLSQAHEDYERLAKPAPPVKAEKSVPVSALADVICCEICTDKMWSPYVLTDCGHIFCQGCLTDWFNTTLVQYLNAHPTYNLNLPYIDDATLARLPVQLRGYIQGVYKQERPNYTCPTCRKEVRHHPIESFAMKTVVRLVADANGEKSPRKASTSTRVTRAGRGGAATVDGAFDGFFGRT